jgi:hypothetical protein
MTSPLDGSATLSAELPIETLAENSGFSDLRSPTARGNTLVVGSRIDPQSLRLEVRDRQTHELRSRIILQLIDNDPDLAPLSKEIVRKLLPLYRESDSAFCPFSVGVLFIMCGGLMFGLGSDSPAISGGGIALMVTSVVVFIIIGVLLSRESNERRGLEKQLEDACTGSIQGDPLLAGVS